MVADKPAPLAREVRCFPCNTYLCATPRLQRPAQNTTQRSHVRENPNVPHRKMAMSGRDSDFLFHVYPYSTVCYGDARELRAAVLSPPRAHRLRPHVELSLGCRSAAGWALWRAPAHGSPSCPQQDVGQAQRVPLTQRLAFGFFQLPKRIREYLEDNDKSSG